ncbi:Rieske 2Fe-2S domain-containing protein [Actinomadura sp. DC4]|uniref:Rieske 2Fe-2S domain-containing protein n=1 Tax=Actinomadura sp. DC4 TaxID=3055069 RepID=UPI0025AFFCDE|nr:Rieske 2Fe-2S domain-containing protein [Actinomadura sp. DC4]MDN3357579.1 Rieske 2Fe-2S domain-containing protein [Actinomadura sp. DC4]
MATPDVDEPRAAPADPVQPLGPLAPVQAAPPPGRTLPGLPMPRDSALLTDPSRRPRIIREPRGRFPFPVPNGWFIVSAADDLQIGEVHPLYYFERELVLFRGADGRPYVLDAHCPHLGAHLAVGGQVEDACIRCPFHGWTFDGGSGRCVDVPYDDTDHIPQRATIRSYPTVERNRMVWVWHHLEGAPPFYDVPEVPEFDDPGWSPIVARDFEIATCCQEMAENNVDRAHFRYVHGTDAIPEEEFHVDGAYKRAVGAGGDFVREGFGLGLGVLRLKGWTTFVSSTTPIDRDHVHVRWIFTSPRELGDGAAENAAETFCAGVSQDIPIWENKVYRDHPVLRPMEKDISEHRRWSRQFYSEETTR